MREVVLGLVVAVAAAGCTSAQRGVDVAMAPAGDMDAVSWRAEEKSFAAKATDAVLSVPETAVWWPYKIVGSTLTGAWDGVADGVDEAPMPILGVIASPLTASWGGVKGVFGGIAMDPYYVGTSADFGAVLGKPFERPGKSYGP